MNTIDSFSPLLDLGLSVLLYLECDVPVPPPDLLLLVPEPDVEDLKYHEERCDKHEKHVIEQCRGPLFEDAMPHELG